MKIILSLLFIVNVIYASVAVVSAFKGVANIYRDGKQLKVSVGVEINKNDNIKTNDKTKLQLIFKDNTRITIGKNSDFSVEDYFYDEKIVNKARAKFRFKKGLFRTISGRIGKINKKQFKIRVKSATIGIRGTKFDVFVDKSVVKVGVYQGAIYFNDNNEITDVKSNEVFVYEYSKDIKVIKKGNLKEGAEFSNKKTKTINKKLQSTDVSDIKLTKNKDNIVQVTQSTIKQGVEEILDTKNTQVIEDDVSEKTEIIEKTEPTPQENVVKEEIVPVLKSLEKLTIDNDTNQIKNIPDLDYGYWIDPNNDDLKVDTFIDGVVTAESVIEDKLNAADGTIATYSGDIASIITDANGNKLDATGRINLNIDFASVSDPLSGNIDINSGQYKASISQGSIISNTFSTTEITDAQESFTQTNAIPVIGGSVNGKFYGQDGNSIGGTFKLNGEDNSNVKGVFGASITQ